ncbi:MFS transporter [Scytonema sp. NUACC26]|uniref:MFS transporter n=1 Tax=Scytonema sp. NUACC26 TaxID=3140176 RepID=UPI0034DC5FE9
MAPSTMQAKPTSPGNLSQDKNFYIINALTLIAILGGTVFNPALPTISQVFNVSSEQVALVATLFQLPGAIVTPIFGILADTFGRKQILVPSLLLFALGGVLSGFAQTFRSLLEWRVVQGIGTASLESLQLTLIGDLYRGRQLGAVMAFNAGLIGMSSALFPLIGGLLTGFSWRFPFMISLIAVPVALLVVFTLKLPKHHTNPQNFQLKPYLQSTWSSINNRQVIGLMFAVMIQFMLQVGTCLVYIPILAGDLGASAAFNGFLLASISISVAIVASQLGRITQKFSEIKLIKFSFILAALAFIITPAIHNVWLLFIPILLIGASQGLAFPSTQALLAGLAAQESRAGFMSVNSTVQSWGQTLGPFLGSIIDMIWGTRIVFVGSAIISILSLVIFNALLATKKPSPSPSPDSPTVALSFINAEQVNLSESFVEVPTIAEKPVARLFHVQSDKVIELPDNFSLIRIGKPNKRSFPDIDLSTLPNSDIVSRIHAEIKFEGGEYYIQDMGSSNGTYINKYPLLPGIWYKLKPGLTFSIGRRDAVSFKFQIA